MHRLDAPKMAVNTDPFWMLERCRLQTGDDLAALGRLADARENWGAIANSLAGPIDSYEPKLLVILEAADMRLGQPAAAEVIAQRLKSMFKPTAGGDLR
jgi:hypothetical protein